MAGADSMARAEFNVIPFSAARPLPTMPTGWAFARRKMSHQVRLAYKWWFRRHRPYKAVFVIATTRTGSNLLLSYLRQLQGLQAKGEVLLYGDTEGPLWERMSPEAAIGHIRRSLHLLRSPIRACKLMLFQLAQYALTVSRLDAAFPQARYIVLYRQSLAEQFISKKLAQATAQYMLRPGEQQRQTRITIDPQELRQYCDGTRQAYRDLLAHDWLRERAAIVSYEELTADASGCLSRKICPLVGVPAIEPSTYLCKQNTLPLVQRVENYQHVAALLASPLCRQHHAWPSAVAVPERIGAQWTASTHLVLRRDTQSLTRHRGPRSEQRGANFDDCGASS
jgi:LPS sulfotransferase NodH